MAEPAKFFDISPSDPMMKNLKDKVVVITGCSSGIGLATTKLCLEHGAKVAGGDMNPCPITNERLLFQQVDVRDWNSQAALFKKAFEKFGRIDHVFANAGEFTVNVAGMGWCLS
jgi:NAD(P)-dependent dehydrogenase (short-subunit alcohol dehydrogenase family)